MELAQSMRYNIKLFTDNVVCLTLLNFFFLYCERKKTIKCVQTGMVTVVLIGWNIKRALCRQSYTYRNTHITHPHTLTHTYIHSVTQSTQTAPRRVPLQLPPLYYWSIWRLLSQGWHGLGDVTAQPINTTLKAQDPQLVCVVVRACDHAHVCICVWAAESCSSCGWTLPFWPVYRTVNYMGRDVHPAPADQLD